MISLMKVCNHEISVQDVISGGIVFAVLLIIAISVVLIIVSSGHILNGLLS